MTSVEGLQGKKEEAEEAKTKENVSGTECAGSIVESRLKERMHRKAEKVVDLLVAWEVKKEAYADWRVFSAKTQLINEHLAKQTELMKKHGEERWQLTLENLELRKQLIEAQAFAQRALLREQHLLSERKAEQDAEWEAFDKRLVDKRADYLYMVGVL